MSVIIKGEDMPDRCANCPCCYTDESDSESFCSVYGDDIPDIFNGRLDGCPLVELHEDHGRLIDADSLIEYINKELKGDEYIQRMFRRIVKSRPTVIEEGV